ncbi:type 4b pilus protein PilO2 [Pseudomonas sp. PCH44]|nr:type 4b pilus protein PilO2 [Pseudomonas sp. PCH44]
MLPVTTPSFEARDALENLTSWFHGFSQEPQLQPIPVVTPQEPALPGQPTPPPPPPPQWQQYQLSYTSGVLPYDSFNGAQPKGCACRDQDRIQGRPPDLVSHRSPVCEITSA